MHPTTPIVWLTAAALTFGAACNPAWGRAIQSRAEIRSAAQAFLHKQVREHFPGKSRIHVGHLDSRLRLNRCNGRLKAFLPPGGHLKGNTTVGVKCDARAGWTVYVSARISLFGKVLVTTHPLARGDRVARADVKAVERDLSRLPYGYISDLSDARGKLVTRMVATGAVLTPGMLTAPRLIHRGDRVMVVAQAAGLQVQMAGKALGDGAAGEKIRVQALSSKRIVQGVVVSPSVVKVTL
ncbi:MAG TPA: flagellar basal body P-ring formation chaperone FlgA [Gammaproteobacteria bacterium]|nr:flagellar basal body P-ring formation chaperone FlgA [Gammaproteobacteria bacterium]